MSEENKIGTYQFVAEPFHVDFNGRLTMGVLGNHLLNCAGFHASDRGFGIATLNEDNYTWVLSRLAIELDEMPYQYEKFSVQTWVENVYRLFTDRNFAVIDKDGKKIGYARSVWAMINLNTRKPADLLALHGGKYEVVVFVALVDVHHDTVLAGFECFAQRRHPQAVGDDVVSPAQLAAADRVVGDVADAALAAGRAVDGVIVAEHQYAVFGQF